MAINQLTEPSSGASSNNNDYTYQNLLAKGAREIGRSILTDWESTAAAPSAGLGAYIRHAAFLFQVQTTDEGISGTPTAGINYIKATVSGTVMTLSYTTSTSGFTYNEAYSGVYNAGGEQLLTDICYKDGTLFKRGRGNGMDFNTYILADGSVIYSGGLKTNGNDINTSGGSIHTGGGVVDSVRTSVLRSYGSSTAHSTIASDLNTYCPTVAHYACTGSYGLSIVIQLRKISNSVYDIILEGGASLTISSGTLANNLYLVL